MEAVVSNWDELIKRRAISDLFNIVRDCNDEISKVVEEFRLRLANATRELDGYQYTSEQFMQIESVLYLCKQYFMSEEFLSTKECGTLINSFAFEEFIGGTVSIDLESEGPVATSKIEYNEGTRLALRLIDKYVVALKDKVIDSASKSMLDGEE